MQLIDKKEFAKTSLNKNSETFFLYVVALKAKVSIYLSRIAQIADLRWDKAPIKILAKYSDYTEIFLSNLAIELPENIHMNEHAIKLADEK